MPRKHKLIRKCPCGTLLDKYQHLCRACLKSRQLTANRERYALKKRTERDRSGAVRKPFEDQVDMVDKRVLALKLLNPAMSTAKIGKLVGITAHRVTSKLKKLYDLVADEEPMRFLDATVMNLAPVVAEKMAAGVIAGSPWWIDRWTRLYEAMLKNNGGGRGAPPSHPPYLSDGSPPMFRDLTLINVNMTPEKAVEELDITAENLRQHSREITSLSAIPGLVRCEASGADSEVDVVP